MDRFSTEQRSNVMRAVRSKDTGIELRLRAALWAKGFRYRKNYSRAAGTPDVAFIRQRLAVFCDSEFWHGFDWDHRKTDFKSNVDFWHRKIERNMARDRMVDEQLEAEGWRVLRFWGREIERDVGRCVATIEQTLAMK